MLYLPKHCFTNLITMERYKQYTPFTIIEFEAEQWEHPVHKHNYYEIIFIFKGEGKHRINDITFDYQAGDVFLLSPEDYHQFEINSRTCFCFFKFTELVFQKEKADLNQKFWMERIESIITLPNQIPGPIRFTQNDGEMTMALYRIIVSEFHQQRCYSLDIISTTMTSLISIIARNLCYKYQSIGIDEKQSKNQISELLTYIRHNVYDSKKVSLEAIGKRFGLSKNYVGAFFKKHTGENLQSYLINYKLVLAENRIRHSHLSLENIALDLGFTDLSHLNKLFKRKFGVMPGKYRKERSGTTN